jgi:hypothetical protein
VDLGNVGLVVNVVGKDNKLLVEAVLVLAHDVGVLEVALELRIVLVVHVLGRGVEGRAHVAPEVLVPQVRKQLVVAKVVQLAELTDRVALRGEGAI